MFSGYFVRLSSLISVHSQRHGLPSAPRLLLQTPTGAPLRCALRFMAASQTQLLICILLHPACWGWDLITLSPPQSEAPWGIEHCPPTWGSGSKAGFGWEGRCGAQEARGESGPPVPCCIGYVVLIKGWCRWGPT